MEYKSGPLTSWSYGHGTGVTIIYEYCKHGHFRLGVIFAFSAHFVFFAKIASTRK